MAALGSGGLDSLLCRSKVYRLLTRPRTMICFENKTYCLLPFDHFESPLCTFAYLMNSIELPRVPEVFAASSRSNYSALSISTGSTLSARRMAGTAASATAIAIVRSGTTSIVRSLAFTPYNNDWT